MVHNKLERSELHDQFMSKDGVEELINESLEEKLELYDYLDLKSPEPEANYPRAALNDILTREKLSLKPGRYDGSAKVKDFLKSPSRQKLFTAVTDRIYDKATGVTNIRNKDFFSSFDIAREEANTASNISPDSAFAGQTTLPVYERHRFVPKIDVQDLAWGSETIDDITFKQPEYTTERGDEESKDIPEGGVIEVTLVKFADVGGKTKKFGGGVAWSDEYALNDLRMRLVMMLMARKAFRDRIRMVNEGIAACMAVAGTSADITLGATPWDLDDLLEMALFDGENDNHDNDYQLNTIFCLKSTAKALISAYLKGNSNNTIGPLTGADPRFFGNLINGIQVINNGLGTPLRVGILRDEAVPAITAGNCLGVDIRWAAQFLEVARSTTVEDNRNAKQQLTERYETRRIGWMITDPEACFNIDVS